MREGPAYASTIINVGICTYIRILIILILIIDVSIITGISIIIDASDSINISISIRCHYPHTPHRGRYRGHVQPRNQFHD
jgi:hypothetical protein